MVKRSAWGINTCIKGALNRPKELVAIVGEPMFERIMEAKKAIEKSCHGNILPRDEVEERFNVILD